MDRLQKMFDTVARCFSVLGEPTRLRILHALCLDEKCVNDIIQATGLAQPNVSRHLGLMYQAGMLLRRREGTQIFYKVADPMYVQLCRTVSTQVTNRSEGGLDGAALSHDGFGIAPPSPIPGQDFAKTKIRPAPPASQKEAASV